MTTRNLPGLERRGQARHRRRGPDDHARRARGVPPRPDPAGPGRPRSRTCPTRLAGPRSERKLVPVQCRTCTTRPRTKSSGWPCASGCRPNRDHAQSVLDAMEAEHQQIDPLLAAVDDAFARLDDGHRADVGAIGDAADALAQLAHRSPGAPGARRPAAHRRGAQQRRVAGGGVQDRPQERIVGGRRDVRLSGPTAPTRTRPPPRSARSRRPRGWPTAPSGGRATTERRAGDG